MRTCIDRNRTHCWISQIVMANLPDPHTAFECLPQSNLNNSLDQSSLAFYNYIDKWTGKIHPSDQKARWCIRSGQVKHIFSSKDDLMMIWQWTMAMARYVYKRVKLTRHNGLMFGYIHTTTLQVSGRDKNKYGLIFHLKTIGWYPEYLAEHIFILRTGWK